MRSVCIFCGANSGNSIKIVEESRTMCRSLTQMDFNLIYGGGLDGLMREAADIFLESGKQVIGIRPEKLIPKEPPDPRVEKMISVGDMFERKRIMIELADLFVALPGGAGTLDEIIEVFTHVKLGYVNKVCALLNAGGFYNPFIATLENMVQKGFLTQESLDLLLIESEPEVLMDSIQRKMQLPEIMDKIACIIVRDSKVLVSRQKGKSHLFLPGMKCGSDRSERDTLHMIADNHLSISLMEDSISYAGTFRGHAHGNCSDKVIQLTCYYANYSGEVAGKDIIEETHWLGYAQKDQVGNVDRKVFDWLLQLGLIK